MTATILGKPYAILEIDRSSAPDFVGTNDRDAQTITIVKGLKPAQKADTILHEAIHIISDELGLALEEGQVARMAVGLYSAGCRIKVEK